MINEVSVVYCINGLLLLRVILFLLSLFYQWWVSISTERLSEFTCMWTWLYFCTVMVVLSSLWCSQFYRLMVELLVFIFSILKCWCVPSFYRIDSLWSSFIIKFTLYELNQTELNVITVAAQNWSIAQYELIDFRFFSFLCHATCILTEYLMFPNAWQIWILSEL